MPQMTVTIQVNPPSKTAPGFARRLRRAAAFQQKVSQGSLSPDVLDDLIDFLADYCEVEGSDRDQVKEALWDASEEQFTALLSAVSGGGAEVPPVS